jgi:glycosidase
MSNPTMVQLVFSLLLGSVAACSPSAPSHSNQDKPIEEAKRPYSSAAFSRGEQSEVNTKQGKPVIYQVFTRLFGNKKTSNKPWGTLEENGVGKFNDVTDEALQAIKELGVTHIWYTGVLHHAVIRDYSEQGISLDDPDVVKGRAGSPYAIKDYYNVDPDLAVDPTHRLDEFKALVERTHKQGLKVIIDIVPNHVARNYQSISKPKGVDDFGATDDPSVEYRRDNNFYYVVGQAFKVPEPVNGYRPLGGEAHPLADGKFNEFPAKWTGNGSRAAQPKHDDWYETVKINYGIRPDGHYDFDRLPAEYAHKDFREHFAFWAERDVPDSWKKYRQIVEYWIDFGIDGFRFDVAELVPVEVWSYLNSAIKMKNPNALLLAEIYQPHLYRDFIYLGKMDYLYDKVDFYDVTKAIMQGRESTDKLVEIQQRYADIEQHLMHFLENHDEQRIASSAFVGDADIARPAMVVSATISRSPTLLYFAQELGESAEEDAGFGDPTRTTIFDYWGVASLQRWMNSGRFDGGQLSQKEKSLRDFYVRLLNLTASSPVFNGNYRDLHRFNRQHTSGYDDRLMSFARWNSDQKVIVIANYDNQKNYSINLHLPMELINQWNLKTGEYKVFDRLYEKIEKKLIVSNKNATLKVDLQPLQSYIFYLSE